MDYPEPLTSMLREYDWNSYIDAINAKKSLHKITIDEVQPVTEYYMLCKRANKVQFPIIIGNVSNIFRNIDNGSSRPEVTVGISTQIIFVIDKNGQVTRKNPNFTKLDVYKLPSDIENEMKLACSFMSRLSLMANPMYEDRNIINNYVNLIISANKFDYLKLTDNKESPLMVATRLHQYEIMKKIIQYYTVDEINHENRNHLTALMIANSSPNANLNIPRVKIIEDGLKNVQLTSIIYPMKVKNVEPDADTVAGILEYLGGSGIATREGSTARETMVSLVKTKKRRRKYHKTHKKRLFFN